MKYFLALSLLVAALVGTSALAGSELKNKGLHTNEYVWDFSVDGGSDTVAIQLDAKAGYHKLPVGAVVVDETLNVETAAAGTSSVYSLGNAASATAYHSSVAKNTLIADYVVKGASTTPYKIIDSTYADLKLTIGTQASTGGKIHFYVTYIY